MTVQTVLVVDDNGTDAWLARRRLEHAGFACLHAATAEHAFELIAAARPDLVVMDLSLPGMDGFEAIRRLRAAEVTRSLPVIAMTAFRADFPEKEAKRLGADAYIEKPNANRTLVDAVRALLPPPRGMEIRARDEHSSRHQFAPGTIGHVSGLSAPYLIARFPGSFSVSSPRTRTRRITRSERKIYEEG